MRCKSNSSESTRARSDEWPVSTVPTNTKLIPPTSSCRLSDNRRYLSGRVSKEPHLRRHCVIRTGNWQYREQIPTTRKLV